MLRNGHRKHGFAHEHSLSIASIGILILWVCLYCISDPSNRIGFTYIRWTGRSRKGIRAADITPVVTELIAAAVTRLSACPQH